MKTIVSAREFRPRSLRLALLTTALSLSSLCLPLLAQPEPGSIVWEHHYSRPGYSANFARAVAIDSASDVVVTGGSSDSTGLYDYYTAKYAGLDGALLWEQYYNGPANRSDEARAIAVDGAGDVVVTGSSDNGPGNGLSDYYTAKYASADGALLWEQRYNGPGNDLDSALSVAVDGAGDVVVTGSSRGANGFDDYYTAKYNGHDGVLVWEQRYNSPADGSDEAHAVAVDSVGNVVVTGQSAGTSNDYYTAKYAVADGALLWEMRYNGPAESTDSAYALAVDTAGNVVVTGVSAGMLEDFYTAKYAAADGALLWEQRYNGPADANDLALAVAVDRAGNVAVTGYSQTVGASIDYYTAKYAADDGALLWEQRYNGPTNSADSPRAVAMDNAGNVAVTGRSNGRLIDYYTAKYAAADGALLWEQRYDSPAHSVDLPQGLAVDRAGNVVVTGYSYSYAITAPEFYTVKYFDSISPPHTPPSAAPDHYVTDEDTVLAIAPPGVLENDSDADRDPLTVGTASATANGALAINADGSFTYTPRADYHGEDEFTYQANDGTQDSNVATVRLTINPVNDAPRITAPRRQSTLKNQPLLFSSAAGNSISVADVDLGCAELLVILTATSGRVTLGCLEGLTFNAGDGTDNRRMSFSGTVNAINAALEGLIFTPSKGFSGRANLSITSNDQGNTGAGGALSDRDTVAIVVRPR